MTRIALLFSLLAATLVVAGEAFACSCAVSDPRDTLESSDGAFIGTILDRRDEPETYEAVLTLSVEQAVKGELGSTVEVRTAITGAACGIESSIGDRVALFLVREGSAWTTNLCLQTFPDVMLEAAEPLPTPTGSGPVALLAGGSYGPMRVAALDAQGRVLAYGPGEGEAYAFAVCPGAERVVEGVFEPTDEGPAYSIEVRDLRTMAVVAKLAPGFVWGSALPDRLRCLDPLGEEAAVFARSEVDLDRLLILSAEGARTVWRGQADAATFTAKRAFVCAGAGGRNVLRVDLRTGGTATLARVPAGTGPLVASPGGRYLAGVSYSSPFGSDAAPSRAVLVDLGVTPRRVKTAPLGGSNVFGEMLWLGPRRVVFVPTRGELDRVRVYDLSLGTVRRGEVMFGNDATLLGQRLIVLSAPFVLEASPPGGSLRELTRLPSPLVVALESVQGGHPIATGRPVPPPA